MEVLTISRVAASAEARLFSMTSFRCLRPSTQAGVSTSPDQALASRSAALTVGIQHLADNLHVVFFKLHEAVEAGLVVIVLDGAW